MELEVGEVAGEVQGDTQPVAGNVVRNREALPLEWRTRQMPASLSCWNENVASLR